MIKNSYPALKPNPIAAAEEALAARKVRFALYKKAEAALKPFEGKKITRALATAIEKALPGYNVFYKKSYSWFEVDIWGEEIPYAERVTLNLGYFSNPIFDFVKFVCNGNGCYSLEEGRLPAFEEGMSALPAKVEEYKAALAVVEAAYANLGEYRSYVTV